MNIFEKFKSVESLGFIECKFYVRLRDDYSIASNYDDYIEGYSIPISLPKEFSLKLHKWFPRGGGGVNYAEDCTLHFETLGSGTYQLHTMSLLRDQPRNGGDVLSIKWEFTSDFVSILSGRGPRRPYRRNLK